MAKFHLSDPDGKVLSVERAEPSLVEVLLDPAEVKYHWKILGDIKREALIVALAVNPSLREEIWDAIGPNGLPALTERDKFNIIINTPDDDEDAQLRVRLFVHDLVSEEYEEV